MRTTDLLVSAALETTFNRQIYQQKNTRKQSHVIKTHVFQFQEQFSLMLSAEKNSTPPVCNTNSTGKPIQPTPKVQEPSYAILENAINAASLNFTNANDCNDQPKPTNQDSLKPPASSKTQLKATHRNANNASEPVANGEGIKS